MAKVHPLTTIRVAEMGDVVRVRQPAKIAGEALGLEKWAVTRLVTTALEIARNAVEHGGGGRVILELADGPDDRRLLVRAVDQGPGVPDSVIKAAFSDRQAQSARPSGGGHGLRGVVRLADSVTIDSEAGGARVTASFIVDDPRETSALIDAVGDGLMSAAKSDRAAALAEQNRELLEALEERDLMLREFHHRTQNNLAMITSMVRLRAHASQSGEVRDALGDIAARIAAIRDVYARLQHSRELDRLHVNPLIRELLEKVADAVSSGRTIEVDVLGPDLHLEASQAVDVALLINELLTNACKHAFEQQDAPRLAVSIIDEADGYFTLTVRDNGCGLAAGAQEPHRSDALGWKVVRSVVSKFDGRLTVNSDDGLAVTVHLRKIGRAEIEAGA
ncbi:MAG: sensor histidine kinase [Oceanicaulis sp.]